MPLKNKTEISTDLKPVQKYRRTILCNRIIILQNNKKYSKSYYLSNMLQNKTTATFWLAAQFFKPVRLLGTVRVVVGELVVVVVLAVHLNPRV